MKALGKGVAGALGLAMAGLLILLPGLSPADSGDAGSAASDAGDSGDAGSALFLEAMAGDGGDAGALLKKVYFIDIPEEDRKTGKTKPPTVAEWRKAEEIELARGGRGCRAFRSREWLKLSCKTDVSVRAEVIAGNTNDIYFFMTAPECSVFDPGIEGLAPEEICSDLVDIVFPMHIGDRRAIQIAALRGGYGGGGMSPFWGTHLISMVWLEDEPGPVVTVNHVWSVGF